MDSLEKKTGESTNPIRILLVDDEPDILRYLKRALSNRGYEVQPVERGPIALELLKESHFDLLLTDLKMPEMDGLSLLRKAKESLPALEVVMMTGFATVESAVGSMKLGAFDYLVKPFNMEEIFTVIQRAVRHLETKNDMIRFQDLDKMKEEFLGNVSHELRTPLASIKSATGILLEEIGDSGKEVDRNLLVRVVAIIDRSSGKMIRMVEDLLDAFRFHAGKITLKKVRFSMARMIAECMEEFLAPCQERGLSLLSEIEPGLSEIVGDPVKLRQVLLNLLGNAMKFTSPGGRIVIGARVPEEDSVEIFVQDSGVGIPLEQQSRVFEKFYQVDGSTTRGKPGLGLGLALVKAIVESHQGTISLISFPGKGSTFIVRLPSCRRKGRLDSPLPSCRRKGRLDSPLPEGERVRVRGDFLQIKGEGAAVCST